MESGIDHALDYSLFASATSAGSSGASRLETSCFRMNPRDSQVTTANRRELGKTCRFNDSFIDLINVDLINIYLTNVDLTNLDIASGGSSTDAGADTELGDGV